MERPQSSSPVDWIIRFCLENRLLVAMATFGLMGWGIIVAPFNWEMAGLPRAPIPVDAIPDIGENQQIVFTRWPGRSPQDIEDQITYPLTVAIMGVPGVKTVRSYSSFGFSQVFIVFKEDVEFYWSRSRVLEKLSSLPPDSLPAGVRPALGPDATALGQVYWYTLEGRDEDGNAAGGWDLQELRSIQDWQVRYALQGVDGVSEVASIGGFVQEYQIDVDPAAMRFYEVTLDQVFNAVRMANVDVGARTIEINKVEYVIRGLGFLKSLEDIENTVVKVNNNVPTYIHNVATVSRGPALRRGALDKSGAEAVGGVVIVRYGENPMAVIGRVKDQIAEIAHGLPSKRLADGTLSRVTVVPFYDRTGLILETLGTLNSALSEEILVTIIVVLLLVFHLRSSLLISGLLPIAVLMTFIAMKVFGVDANIVALSGIAIAIGTMVDMAIVICENILKHLERADPEADRLEVIFEGASEVGGAILTAVLTTIVSFLPVFAMEAAEGKLFRPLAFTKTFALAASVIVALTIIPPTAYILFARRELAPRARLILYGTLAFVSLFVAFQWSFLLGSFIAALALYNWLEPSLNGTVRKLLSSSFNFFVALAVAVVLARSWMPLGPERGAMNVVFVVVMVGFVLGGIWIFIRLYEPILRWCLENKSLSMLAPAAVVLAGALAWIGFGGVFSFVPRGAEMVGIDSTKIEQSSLWRAGDGAFPGLGKEFMPPLDEGSFLFMPTTMAHASIGESLDVLQKQDRAIRSIPEIESVVGKLGRAESALDPAPISMVETIINYKSEYLMDENGKRLRFRYDKEKEDFVRAADGNLIPDSEGRAYRQWREHIRRPDDIWHEIVEAGRIPGSTSAPRLQPIAARLVMLQSGMRAPMGVKVYGPDLASVEQAGLRIERLLKEVPSVYAPAVLADRIVGKPYIEIDIDREAIARHGLHIRGVQDVIEVAIGGRKITSTVEGRERYPVRVRYMRELRDQIESLKNILVPAPDGTQIPLGLLTTIHYRPGPQVIKSEDTFLVGYVLFDKKPGFPETTVVEECQRYLQSKLESGEFVLPAGVSYRFAGNYENQLRSEQRLRIVLPVAMLVIVMILYFQFKSIATTFLIFSGILVAWAGGFILIWFYGQDWFLNFHFFGIDMRELFQISPINLSVAVWVGFLALFGIASDNGVILATYLKQTFDRDTPDSIAKVREATVEAGMRRIRPCMMTSATTILALVPILTSFGRGSDVMVPMAIPSFGGMTVVMISVFVVPTLYCAIEEWKLKFRSRSSGVK